jgi:hypothetical protein
MTQMGHLITGTALGVASLPRQHSRGAQALHLIIFAILGTIPDWSLHNWGHERYYFSHSLFVSLVPIAATLFLFLFLPDARRKIGGWPVLFTAALAWLSHLLLDSFYNHGYGIAIFWPYSEARLILPIPWLAVAPGSAFPPTPAKLREVFLELATFSPLIVLGWMARRGWIFLRTRKAARES